MDIRLLLNILNGYMSCFMFEIITNTTSVNDLVLVFGARMRAHTHTLHASSVYISRDDMGFGGHKICVCSASVHTAKHISKVVLPNYTPNCRIPIVHNHPTLDAVSNFHRSPSGGAVVVS